MTRDSKKESNTEKTTIGLRGVDLPMIRKGSGPQILILHGGDGPIDRFPFADQLAERYELMQPYILGLPALRYLSTLIIFRI